MAGGWRGGGCSLQDAFQPLGWGCAQLGIAKSLRFG